MDSPSFVAIMLASTVAMLACASIVARVIGALDYPVPPAASRAGSIDGLRGYLALGVLGHHFIMWTQQVRFGATEWRSPIHVFEELGAGSVALFFMITGFVFYPKILGGLKNFSFKNLIINRIFRLMPLLAVVVACMHVILYLRVGTEAGPFSILNYLSWVTTIQFPPLLGVDESWRLNAGVLWTLQLEWVFYLLLLPACVIAMSAVARSELPSWLVPLMLFMLAGAAYALKAPQTFTRYPPVFAVGMLAYEAQMRPRIATIFQHSAMKILAIASLAAGMIVFARPYTAALPLFGFFFVSVACGNDFFGLFRTKSALVLGECSYGIYLSHGLLLSILFQDFHGVVEALPLYQLALILPLLGVIVVPVTAAAYLVVEKPMIRLGRKFTSGSGRRAVPPLAEKVAP